MSFARCLLATACCALVSTAAAWAPPSALPRPLRIPAASACQVRLMMLLHSEDDLLTHLDATEGQMDGFFSQLPYKCYLEEVASVGY